MAGVLVIGALVGILWLTKPGLLLRHRSASPEERDLIKPMRDAVEKEMPANSFADPYSVCPPVEGKIAMWDLSTDDLTYQPLTWGVRDAFRPIPIKRTDAMTDRIFEAGAVVFVRNSSQPASTRNTLMMYTGSGNTFGEAKATESCFGLVDKGNNFLCGRCFRGNLAEQLPAEQAPYALPPDPEKIAHWLSFVLSGRGTPALEGVVNAELYVADGGGVTLQLHNAYDLSRSGDHRRVVLSSEPLSNEVLTSKFWVPDQEGEITAPLARLPAGAPLIVLASMWVIHQSPGGLECTGNAYVIHSSLIERGYANGVITPDFTCRFAEVGDDKLTGMIVLNPTRRQNARLVAEYHVPASAPSK